MKIEIITPDKKLYEGNIKSAIFPGSEGSFGILNNHRSSSYIDDYDFPANLENYLSHSKRTEELIKSYIEIIRRAGRFSK